MSRLLLVLRNLSFHHPESRPLLDSIDLEVAVGDRILLTGPSGAGKSTLLYLMGGIIPRWIPGSVTGSVERGSEEIATVFQNPEAQMVAPTVEEELAFGLENQGLAREEMRSRVREITRRFGLEGYLPRSPAELSGGERQKVALASALAMRPELLLLDEPTSYLDPTSTAEFFALLEELPAETAIVMVEHKLDQAVRFARRLLFLNEEGRLEELPCEEGFEPARFLPWRLEELAAEGAPRPDEARRENPDPSPSLTEPAAVSAAALSHTYGNGRSALRSVSLALRAGESVAVMGPNGAGKSTLLAKLAGTLPVGLEEVFLGGIDSARLTPRERFGRLLFLPQNPEHFFLRERVDEELFLSASGSNAAEPRTEMRIEEAAQRFGLSGLRDRSPYSLSEGEKRRLNLCCAFLDDRRLLLLDEPTFGLDYSAFKRLIEALRGLKREGGALVLVTHSPELAFLAADRLLFLNDGEVHFEGTPEEATRTAAFPRAYLPVWERERCKG